MNTSTKVKQKRVLCFLLALATVFSMLPAMSMTASADDVTLIDSVDITGVIEPVEGETPKYDCVIPEDCGYYIDEVYWCVYGATYRMGDDETFVAGKKYEIAIVLYPEDGYSFADRKELNATVNGSKAKDIGVYASYPEMRIIHKSMVAFHKDEQIIDVSTWGELKEAFREAKSDAFSMMAAENITVRLQSNLYLDADDLPRNTVYMVQLSVFRNMTLDFNGYTMYGDADLPQDENSILESFIEIKVHPNYYIKDMETVFTLKDSRGGGGIDFEAHQWKDSQLAALHIDMDNTYWLWGYLDGAKTLIEQSTSRFSAKLIIEGGNYKMNCDTVKFSNGTHCLNDAVRYRGTVIASNIKTVINGGRFEAYCDGVTVKKDNFGARDLAAFGIETIYVGNSGWADPENDYYEKYRYGEDLTINDGVFISDNGYSVRHFDRYHMSLYSQQWGFEYFIAPMLNGGEYYGPVNFTSKSFIYLNNGSDYLNKKNLVKMSDPGCILMLNGEVKTASQITLGDLAKQDTESFIIIDNAEYCRFNDVSLNGKNLGQDMRGTVEIGTNNTLTWTFDDLEQEFKDLGFSYKISVRDNKGGAWKEVTPAYSDGVGTVTHRITANTAGTMQPGFMIELYCGSELLLRGGYGFRLTVKDTTKIYNVGISWIDTPVDGGRPDFSANTGSGSLCSVKSIAWYNDTDKKDMSSSDTFAAGKKYTVKVTLTVGDGYAFADKNSLKVKFNDNLQASFVSALEDGTQVVYSYSYTGAEKIYTADVTVDGVEAFTSYGYKDSVSGDPVKYTTVAEVLGLYEAVGADEILPDDSCRIVVGFIPNDGYAFPDTKGSGMNVTINGQTADYYDYFDGCVWFSVDYYIQQYEIKEIDFGYTKPESGDSIDDFMISINNLSQRPNEMITVKDVCWVDNGTDEEYTWIDMADGAVFEDGHNYYCTITFGVADGGYRYWSSGDLKVTANGVNIPSIYDYNGSHSYNPPTGDCEELDVSLCLSPGADTVIRSVEATVTEPVAGNACGGVSIDKAANKISYFSSSWVEMAYDGSGELSAVKTLENGDLFEAGKIYRLMVTVYPEVGFTIDIDASVYINGRRSEYLYLNSSGGLTVYMDFECSASGVEGAYITGTVTSYGSESADVTVQLIASGASEAEYEVTVRGNSAAYKIPYSSSGVYTLRFMKDGHAPRDYKVVVSGSLAYTNAVIRPYGDTTGDGKLNGSDLNYYKRILLGRLTVDSGSYDFKVDDYNSDTKINGMDANFLLRYIMGR